MLDEKNGNTGIITAEVDSTSRIATNMRMLLILEALSKSPVPLSPTEINRSIGLPKQSIHRLCQTLVDEGFIVRDLAGKRLAPAPRALTMARGMFRADRHSFARREVLEQVAKATRETVNLAAPEAGGMTYLDRVETDWIFRTELPVGSRVPFYCTASGKCYLASLERRELDRLLSTLEFERRTSNTYVERDELDAELHRIKQQGFALDEEELFDGMVAIAVPIYDRSHRFLAALACHGPTLRLDRERLLGHLDVMRDGAEQLASLDI
ncbi:IclR family transcriptional regulator [Ahrensia sp. R2A130]|uniref:IclR family transcriptional regulator n=1 Tax=Ahrensia sp. R2A130 TaxID=744979 RepID=UPI0001E0B4E4|nr:IclR family transcriptional regulator [Ahrensia sp. R2A130]EFL88734.1 IclR family transcriptional regulator [Ahrensia sp. R2A130]